MATRQPTGCNLIAATLISAKDETIATLREQLEAERNAHAEARRLLLEALMKIPSAIEAPQEEATEAAETVEEQQGRGQPPSDAPGAPEGVQRPWRSLWRRTGPLAPRCLVSSSDGTPTGTANPLSLPSICISLTVRSSGFVGVVGT